MSLDSGARQVPMGWWSAQDGASRLLASGGLDRPPGSFESRCVHDVLSLTLFFSHRGPGSSPGRLPLLRALLADDVQWAVWCHGRLAHDRGVPAADAKQARRAWDWLVGSRLLAGAFYDAYNRCTVDASRPGAGASIGVALARGVLDERADG